MNLKPEELVGTILACTDAHDCAHVIVSVQFNSITCITGKGIQQRTFEQLVKNKCPIHISGRWTTFDKL